MIIIENEQDQIEVPESLLEGIKEAILFTLKDQGVEEEAEISMLLVDNDAIKEMNREYRNIDKETDVLSFPMISYEEGQVFRDEYLNHQFGPEFYDGDALLLGDVVLSMEKANEQALEFGHSLKREACYLTIHSILHLLGYDHMTDMDKQRMREAEERILHALDISRE
ncbi:rRNA maturation RNase YbeY [Proteiniclasticum ruminis]|uniref:Endoribonuclease YbeY n=1 Tax=Proteiniclasticum ruminis TaxID=398199 RepID=A0A1I4YPA3_9CLOT|nr:rRNA maturation RNase YbeY [Proteiniclasticum ruminis]SFN39854.1 probable rRNA maturation factor [Proteiniclasticum ruminis]